MSRRPPRRSLALASCLAVGTIGSAAGGVRAQTGSGDQAGGESTPTRLVEIVDARAIGVDAARAVVDVGGEVLVVAPEIVLAEIPIDRVGDLTDDVEGFVRSPVDVDVRPERLPADRPVPTTGFGPTTGGAEDIVGATAWHDAGLTGAGTTIGVIDFFDTSFWDVDEHGPFPTPGVDAFCFDRGASCAAELSDGDDLGGEDHGVAVVEILRDLAPGADIVIGQASTTADYHLLIERFAAAGVDIINRSLGSRYDGPGDGSGPLNAVVDRASELGMLWVNSGGNAGDNRYYRHPARVSDDRVLFGSSGNDTYLAANRCLALGGLRWANDWDVAPSDRTDYDVLIWDAPDGRPSDGVLVEASTARQRTGAPPLEIDLDPVCPSGPGRRLYVEIIWNGGNVVGDVLELLDYGNGFTRHTSRTHSAAVPVVDSRSRSAIAVAAIDPPTGTAVAPYSSAGPTNDGRSAIDVAAPSGFRSVAFAGDTFSGTSAAAPVVAGSAALLHAADLAFDEPGYLAGLTLRATVPASRPTEGRSTTLGAGRLELPPPPTREPSDARPSRLVALDAPFRVLDTRRETLQGTVIGPTWPGQTVGLPVDAVPGGRPPGATAALVNLVTDRPDARSHLQVLRPFIDRYGDYSNLNADAPEQIRANLTVVPLEPGVAPAVYTIARGHLVADVLGFFVETTDAESAGRLVTLPTPQRRLDTRQTGSRLRSGQTLEVDLGDELRRPEVAAAVVSIVAVTPTAAGWIQAIPGRRPDLVGTTSTVNVAPGTTAANLAIVPVTDGTIAIAAEFQNGGGAHAVIDVIGYVTSDAAEAETSGLFLRADPVRVHDARIDPGRLITADAPFDITATVDSLPAWAEPVAAFWNLTVDQATRNGHVTAWSPAIARPGTSAMNWSTGETRAAAGIAALADGRTRLVVDDGPATSPGGVTYTIADLFGVFLR